MGITHDIYKFFHWICANRDVHDDSFARLVWIRRIDERVEFLGRNI